MQGARAKGAGAQREASGKKSSEEDSSSDDALTTEAIQDPAASSGSITDLDIPEGGSDSPSSGSPTHVCGAHYVLVFSHPGHAMAHPRGPPL